MEQEARGTHYVLTTYAPVVVSCIGVASALLPVVGVLVRFVSFWLSDYVALLLLAMHHKLADVPNIWDISGDPSPALLAVRLSAPELAATGLVAVIPCALGLVGFFVYAAADEVLRARLRLTHGSLSRGRVVLLSAGLIGAGLFGALNPHFFGVVAGFMVASILYILVVIDRIHDRAGMILATIGTAVLFILFAGIAGGFTGAASVTVRAADYRFRPRLSGVVADGRYVSLAQGEGLTYLQACVGLRIHAIQTADIVDVSFEGPTAKPTAAGHWRAAASC